MKTVSRMAAVVAWVVLNALFPARAETITFDDIAFSGGDPFASQTLAAGYHGLDWGGQFGANSWAVSPNDAVWFNTLSKPIAHSGNVFAWATAVMFGPVQWVDITVHGGGTFDVSSLWIRITQPQTVTMRGFLGGTQTFVQTVPVTEAYSLASLNFIHIDRFLIDAPTTNPVLDDITVTNISAVPEGASAPLLLAGLLGLILARRPRRAGRLASDWRQRCDGAVCRPVSPAQGPSATTTPCWPG